MRLPPARRTRPPIILRPEGLMGMEGEKEKRKIEALTSLVHELVFSPE